MGRYLTISIGIALVLCTARIQGQGVVINEFMSNNESSIQDEDGDYSDWIELYNPGDAGVNLLNFSLSDNGGQLDKWSFPDVVIPPNGYLVVFSSGKNRMDPQELHSNFSISAQGEPLFLSNSTGEVIDQIPSMELADDESFGRLPDGGTDWMTLHNDSPGNTNNGNDHLVFSHSAGFFDQPFNLEMEALLGDTIRYTLDGSEPTFSSEEYISPLYLNFKYGIPNVFSEIPTSPQQHQISYKAWKSPGYAVEKSHVLRAATFRNGQRTSPVYTQTYLVDSTVFSRYDLPVISLVTASENFFDPEIGIYVPGLQFDPANAEWTGNYYKRGEAWERPVHIEYFNPDGTLIFGQDAGVRIHGGKTRQAAQKSLRMYARNEYGAKYFNHQLLPQKELDQYKRFLLRATMGSWGDQSIIKDALAHEVVRELDVDHQDYRPVVVFLNGEYWGIHTIRDRIDERYVSYTHNIHHDSVMLRQDDNASFNELLSFMESNDLSESDSYEFVKSKIDLPNFIDYYIAELFFANYDWLPNNEEVWRSQAEDGKWRWIFYDLDAGLDWPRHNSLLQATTSIEDEYLSTPEGTFFFRQMLRNEEFREVFLERFAEILNDHLKPERTVGILHDLKQLYASEIESHSERWKYPYNRGSWEDDLEHGLANFLEDRPCAMEEHIVDFFSLNSFGFNCANPLSSQSDQDFIVGPNPTTGYLFMLNNTSREFSGSIQIATSTGRIVQSFESIVIRAGEKRYEDFSRLGAGVYFVKFIGGGFNASTKVLVYR